MSVVKFNTNMKQYGVILSHLQPPSFKNDKLYNEADWRILNSVDEQRARDAIFNAIPKFYQKNIESQYEKDYRAMDDNEFLDAMLAYERADNVIQEKKAKEFAKLKEAKKKANKRKI